MNDINNKNLRNMPSQQYQLLTRENLLERGDTITLQEVLRSNFLVRDRDTLLLNMSKTGRINNSLTRAIEIRYQRKNLNRVRRICFYSDAPTLEELPNLSKFFPRLQLAICLCPIMDGRNLIEYLNKYTQLGQAYISDILSSDLDCCSRLNESIKLRFLDLRLFAHLNLPPLTGLEAKGKTVLIDSQAPDLVEKATVLLKKMGVNAIDRHSWQRQVQTSAYDYFLYLPDKEFDMLHGSDKDLDEWLLDALKDKKLRTKLTENLLFQDNLDGGKAEGLAKLLSSSMFPLGLELLKAKGLHKETLNSFAAILLLSQHKAQRVSNRKEDEEQRRLCLLINDVVDRHLFFSSRMVGKNVDLYGHKPTHLLRWVDAHDQGILNLIQIENQLIKNFGLMIKQGGHSIEELLKLRGHLLDKKIQFIQIRRGQTYLWQQVDQGHKKVRLEDGQCFIDIIEDCLQSSVKDVVLVVKTLQIIE